MDEILKKLESIEGRIGGIENRLTAIETKPKSTPAAPVYRQTYTGAPVVSPIGMASGAPAPKAEQGGGAESYIGRWVAGIVGIIAIVLGVGYFLKLIFDSGLIGPVGQVIIGLLGGLGFIVLGEYVRGKQKTFSYILSTAGLGLLYVSTYAAYGFYTPILITATTSFMFMTLVTLFGVGLAIWVDAVELALLTTAIGFLVPYLFGDVNFGDIGYFIYTISLNIGILGVGYFKKWYPLAILGFGGTAMHFGTWHATMYRPEKLGLTIFALTSFYLIYLIVGTLMSYAKGGVKSDNGELFVLTITPMWFFFWLYNIMPVGNNTVLAFIAAILALVYVVLAYSGQKFKGEGDNMPMFLGGIAAVFLTIAIPLQFSGNAITIAWATEAVIIAILGMATSNEGMRKASLIIFGIAIWRLFMFDSGISEIDLMAFTPFINLRFFTYLVATLAGAVIAYMFGHMTPGKYKASHSVVATLWIVVNFLILVSVTTDIQTYYQSKNLAIEKAIQQKTQQLQPQGQVDAYGQPVPTNYYDSDYYDKIYNSPERQSNQNKSNAMTSVFWTIYSIILIALGIGFNAVFLRWSAIILFAITIFKVFLVDLAFLDTPYKIASLMILGVILLMVSYLYFKHQKTIENKTSI